MFKQNTHGSSRPPKRPCLNLMGTNDPKEFLLELKIHFLAPIYSRPKSLTHQKSISQRFVVSFLQFSNTIFYLFLSFLFLKSGTPKIKTFLIRTQYFYDWLKVHLTDLILNQKQIFLRQFFIQYKYLRPRSFGIGRLLFYEFVPTPPNSEIICGQNVGTKVVCGVILYFSNFQHSFLFKKENYPTNHFCAHILAIYYF